MTTIVLNGKETEIKEGLSVQEFIKMLDLPSVFAIELNGEIIYKENYSVIYLNDKDTMEIVNFTGGG